MGVPVIIHEQTSVVGRSNKASAFFAKKVAISRETSKAYFPTDKIILTGNPLPKDIVIKNTIQGISKFPTVLITGGQSGSVAINNVIEKVLPELIKKYKVIHLTGLKEEEKFKNIRSNIRNGMNKNYEVYGIVDPNKYNQIFNKASILISRAGANTVSKIIASKKPAILIPLPFSYLKEQEINAQFASRYSGARVIKQKYLNSETLLKELKFIHKNWIEIYNNLESVKNPDINASKNIVSLMQDYVK
jgi:UDP-N-acetylglucosamine--N-acetylmuramyl-(pentapeptide) pyrophosphoryl-undecaprenol N-acetylglucosamine transferase